jgi:hypothetical protein
MNKNKIEITQENFIKNLNIILNKNQSVLIERNKTYSMGFLEQSQVLKCLFTKNKIDFTDEMQTTRFYFINMIITKLVRYCDNIQKGHEDSIIDLSNYASLLAAFDATQKENKK